MIEIKKNCCDLILCEVTMILELGTLTQNQELRSCLIKTLTKAESLNINGKSFGQNYSLLKSEVGLKKEFYWL